MKKYFFAIISFCVIATCYAMDTVSTKEESSIVAQDVVYVKDVQLYTLHNNRFSKSKTAELYRQRSGYGYSYFIQIKNTSIKMFTHSRTYNTPGNFNSWSVDSWGIYYYYDI